MIWWGTDTGDYLLTDKLICSFQINMSSEQKIQFKKIIDAIVADDGIIALEAYTRGVIEGIALRNKYVK